MRKENPLFMMIYILKLVPSAGASVSMNDGHLELNGTKCSYLLQRNKNFSMVAGMDNGTIDVQTSVMPVEIFSCHGCRHG